MSSAFALLLMVLVILPVIHVLGHYAAARLVGVRVLTLSLGFGRKVVKVRRGNTDYCIGVLPVGSHMEMAGELEYEPRSGAPDDFLSKTKWQRLLVLLGGPVANILFAVVVVAFAIVGRYELDTISDLPPVVGRVAVDSPAQLAGLQAGDRIVSVNDETIDTWQALDLAIGTRPGREIRITYERMGNLGTLQMKAGPDQYLANDVGIEPDVYPVVIRTIPGERADAAGIKVGDVVRAVDGVRMVLPEDLRGVVAGKAGVDVDLTIARDGVEQHIRVTPIARDGAGFIGVVPGLPTKEIWVGPVAALQQSLLANYGYATASIRAVRHPFSPKVRQLQGPIRMARDPGAVQPATFWMLTFLGMLSLNLGLLNLLPVPVICDGGRIVTMLMWPGRQRDEAIGT